MLQSYPSLQHLNLSHNQISSIEDYAFTATSSLTTLDLSNNRLRKLAAPLSARPLLDLKILRLDNNNLIALAEDLFDTLLKLELLVVSGNYLKTITERTMRPLYYLKVLNVAENHLESITFMNPRLEILDLSGNELAASGIAGLAMSKLEILDLSRNPLGKLSDLNLVNISMLKYINMNSMKLISLDNDFEGPASLRVLSFRNNDYTNISQVDFTRFSKLRLIQLDGNQLKEIDLKNLPHGLTFIGINDNNFDCKYLEDLLWNLTLKEIRLYFTKENLSTTEGRNIQGVSCSNKLDEIEETVAVKVCQVVDQDFSYTWHTSLATSVCFSLAVVYILILWLYRRELKKIKDSEYSDVEDEKQTLTYHDLLTKDQSEYEN